jgi:hypothetical protein
VPRAVGGQEGDQIGQVFGLAHAFEGWSLCVECRERMANGDIQYFIEAQQRTTSKRR